jgi:hypothetical protein
MHNTKEQENETWRAQKLWFTLTVLQGWQIVIQQSQPMRTSRGTINCSNTKKIEEKYQGPEFKLQCYNKEIIIIALSCKILSNNNHIWEVTDVWPKGNGPCFPQNTNPECWQLGAYWCKCTWDHVKEILEERQGCLFSHHLPSSSSIEGDIL